MLENKLQFSSAQNKEEAGQKLCYGKFFFPIAGDCHTSGNQALATQQQVRSLTHLFVTLRLAHCIEKSVSFAIGIGCLGRATGVQTLNLWSF